MFYDEGYVVNISLRSIPYSSNPADRVIIILINDPTIMTENMQIMIAI